MKKTIHLFMALSFSAFLISCNHNSQTNASSGGTPEEVAEKFVKILSEKNYTDLSDITLTKQQRLDIINKSTYDSLTKKDFASKADEDSKNTLTASKTAFDNTTKDLENVGVVLKEIKYKTCDYTLNKVNDVFSLDLYITIDFKGSEYKVVTRSLLKDSSWHFTGNMAYVPETTESDREMIEQRAKFMQDSIAAAINASMEDASK